MRMSLLRMNGRSVLNNLSRPRVVSVGVVLVALVLGSVAQAGSHKAAHQDKAGFEAIFNGKNLDGWSGDPELWRVEDGAIVGQTTKQNRVSDSNFMIWQGGTPENFILELEYKIPRGNSGIQYRSFKLDGKYRLGGYQADIDAPGKYAGANYGEEYGGMLANRGQVVTLDDNRNPTTIESLGSVKALGKVIHKDDWNTYRIIAQGHTLIHQINGHVTSIVIDNDKDKRRMKGHIGFQLHPGPPMKVMFRRIRLKRLSIGKN